MKKIVKLTENDLTRIVKAVIREASVRLNEDIFDDRRKLKNVISDFLDKKPFTNNADWGSAYVWNLHTDDNYVGTFLYLGDDELLILKRVDVDGEYEDEVLKIIRNERELFRELKRIKERD